MKTRTSLILSTLPLAPPLRRGLPRKQQLPRTQATWTIRGFLLIPLAVACLALLPQARADCLQGCDLNLSNTFLGDNALSLNSGGINNTAVGARALFANTTGNNNTATGYEALTTNETGSDNTANGFNALHTNRSGSFNAAIGSAALYSNTTGIWNTATGGWGALYSNIDGSYNTADGLQALFSNTSGNYNTACGLDALFSNITGSNNTALGNGAGGAITTGSDNIDIGHGGFAGDSAKIRIGTKGTHKNTYIAGIYQVPLGRVTLPVLIDSSGHLGTASSSARFKEAIKPMDKVGEAILALKPVSFRYKPELDPEGIPQFGLIAEEVEKVNPDLVARDEQGKAYTVRYEAVNAMLLNEFLKEHRKVEEQEATITQLKSSASKQQATIAELKATITQQQKDFQAAAVQREEKIQALAISLKEQASQIQKVNAQIAATKPTPQLIANNP